MWEFWSWSLLSQFELFKVIVIQEGLISFDKPWRLLFSFLCFYGWKARRNVRFHSFIICEKLHIFVYNKLIKWSKSPIYLKPRVLYLGSTNLFHVFALLLEVWISSWHKKLAMSLLAFYIKIFQLYISGTSYFGEQHDPAYSALEKKVFHSCLSRILSKKFRKA